MIVEITERNSVHKGKIGWLLEHKHDAQDYHDPVTYNFWDHFIFLADYDEINGVTTYYGSTHGFNEGEFRRIK